MKSLMSFCVASILLASCANTTKTSNVQQKESLTGSWELTTLDGKKVSAEKPVYLQLGADNTVSGFVGCNSVSGTYSVQNAYQIKFSNLATTRATCQDQSLENDLLQTLNTVNFFTVKDGQLMVTIGRRAPMALFTKVNKPEVVNKYWKLVELDGKKVQMAANQEREQYFILRNDGSFNGFGGCNLFGGTYQLLSGNRIKFEQNMAATLRACPDVSVNETEMFQVFLQANNYTLSNGKLYLNVGNRMPLAVFEAVYF